MGLGETQMIATQAPQLIMQAIILMYILMPFEYCCLEAFHQGGVHHVSATLG